MKQVVKINKALKTLSLVFRYMTKFSRFPVKFKVPKTVGPQPNRLCSLCSLCHLCRQWHPCHLRHLCHFSCNSGSHHPADGPHRSVDLLILFKLGYESLGGQLVLHPAQATGVRVAERGVLPDRLQVDVREHDFVRAFTT